MYTFFAWHPLNVGPSGNGRNSSVLRILQASQSKMSFACCEYKLVVFGSGGVGKSALTIRLVSDNFLTAYDPTIEDSYRKQALLDGRGCVLDVLDTAGQEDFACMHDQWIREGQGFVLAYSVIDRSSFEELKQFRSKILRVKDKDAIPMTLVATKCDMKFERQVLESEGRDLAQQWGISFFETSAKNSINISEPFFDCARKIRDSRPKAPKKKGCIIL